MVIRIDGSAGESFPLGETTTIGRHSGPPFSNDSYLSPRHATFVFGPKGLIVRDEQSLNGIYIRLLPDQPVELQDGAIFRIGQELIRFERLVPKAPVQGVEHMGSQAGPFVGRIALLIGRESVGNCYCIPPKGLHLGRERGDILFPEDGYVSGLHCRIYESNGKVYLVDVGSSNGTFLRIRGEAHVPSGGILLMGQELLRVEYS
ncbi:MAG: FHA domain-containing protein [Sandaracinaceae bacterium]|nr:FHA domain-containing protein [Sandaracinaceae bacterium]